MLIETGRVVALEADSLWVETIRRSTCGSCAAQKGCGHGLLNRIRDGQVGLVRVLPGQFSPAEYQIDDEVEIGIPDEVIVRGSLVVYMLPLLTLLAGAALAARWLPLSPDLAAGLGMLGGFAIGLLVVRWHAWRHRNDRRLQPVLMGAPLRRAGVAHALHVT
tara:strand:- start:110307 stop:110792 length:486 start_codon:yes stop_codon:yes gene_type:complete